MPGRSWGKKGSMTNIQDPCCSCIPTRSWAVITHDPLIKPQIKRHFLAPQHSRGLTTDKYLFSFHTASTLNKNSFPSSLSNHLLYLRHFTVQNFCTAFCPRSPLYSTAYQIPVSLNMKNARFNEQICNERPCCIVLNKQAWCEMNASNILHFFVNNYYLFLRREMASQWKLRLWRVKWYI